MGTKKIYIGADGREVILRGVNAVAAVVGSTLGAAGKNVIINKHITKDGYTCAKAIRLNEADEAIGANAIKEVAEKTVQVSGDGTSTATILAQFIISEGFKLLAAGYKGQGLKSGIDKAVAVVVKNLQGMAEKIEIDSPKLKDIASISGNNNEEIGAMVSEAFLKTGKDGVITLEHSNTGESYVKIVEGLSFSRGYLSQLFITNKEKLTCEFKDAFILITENKVTTLKEIQPILEKVAKENKSIVFIAEDFDGEALYTINTNRMKGFPICLVKSPGFGDNKKQLLQDIGAVTGAKVVNDESGLRIDKLSIHDLGVAASITIGKDETVIVGGGGEKHDIDEQVRFIKKSIELCPAENPFEKKQLEERLAKLSGGVGVIYVGAATEVELKEKFDRFDDAHRATFCAISEGIVVGGGIALIRCQDALDELKGVNKDEQAGIDLLKEALEAPFRQMVTNSGKEIMVKEVRGNGQNFGYNFKTDNFEDLVESGVIDPVKVSRVALENAASVAGTLLTTDSVIINVDDELPMLKR